MAVDQFLPVDISGAAKPAVDNSAWLDSDGFNNVDLSGPQSLADELLKIADETAPRDNPVNKTVDTSLQPAGTLPGLEPDEVAAAEAQPVVEEPPKQEVLEFDDGTTITIEQDEKGWKATLDSGTGAGKEVFRGKTKNEMYQNAMHAKVAATKKIRELTRKEKLGLIESTQETAPQPKIPDSAVRPLTADESFEIKAELAADPAKALDKWFSKRTGMTPEQLVALAEMGRFASDELYSEAVGKEFINTHPDYYPWEENYEAIIAYIVRHKLHVQYKPAEREKLFSRLIREGHWTTTNLDEAYRELSEDGLLEPAPVVESKVAAVAAPNTESNDARIVRQVRRPRAGLGIRASEVSASPVIEDEKPLSADTKFDNLSDAEVAKLFQDIRRVKLNARR